MRVNWLLQAFLCILYIAFGIIIVFGQSNNFDFGKPDGMIVLWGENEFGQCDLPSPNSDFVDVAAGYKHSLGLKADGSIVAWGDGGNFRLEIPKPNENPNFGVSAFFDNQNFGSVNSPQTQPQPQPQRPQRPQPQRQQLRPQGPQQRQPQQRQPQQRQPQRPQQPQFSGQTLPRQMNRQQQPTQFKRI